MNTTSIIDDLGDKKNSLIEKRIKQTNPGGN